MPSDGGRLWRCWLLLIEGWRGGEVERWRDGEVERWRDV